MDPARTSPPAGLPSAGQLAAVAGLLADRTRAAMCLALLDGTAWTAGELARHTGVARSTASEHLTALTTGGLLTEERQGRHRYVRLAGPRVAALVEDLAGLTGAAAHRPSSLRSARVARGLAEARSCYDHLAGRLGVALLDGLLREQLLDDGLALSAAGRAWCDDLLGPDLLSRNRSAHRPLTRSCLDWTERRAHLGGALGAALLEELLRRRWLLRGEGRALREPDDGPRLVARLGLTT